MNAKLFANALIITPDGLLEGHSLLCSDGRIEAIGPVAAFANFSGPIIDGGGGYIGPGYVDLHVHGGGGADYMDGDTAAVVTANQVHAAHGTTTVFPTTTTGTPQQIDAMLASCAAVKRDWEAAMGARLGGVHLYGPYFAEDKVGCHSPAGRRDPRPQEYLSHLRGGLVRVATCAAELPGAEEFYREARAQGCLVTCGHSNSTWTEMQRAFDAGMRHVDHFWCAMSSIPSLAVRYGTPMQGSMEQFVIMQAEMSTEVLADGYHLAPELLEYAYRMKGARRLCLVTDTSRALDVPPGAYRFGSKVDGPWFHSDGQVGRTGDGDLSSTVSGMDRLVAHMWGHTSAPLHEVVRMAALTPAELTGMAHEIGSLEAGKLADIVISDGQMKARRVFLGGEEFRPGDD